jgi:hypothetical protein
MNPGLGQMSQSFAVGAIAIFGLLLVMPFRNELIEYLKKRLPRGGDLSAVYTLIYLALVLTLGIIVEDFSKDIVAGRFYGVLPENIDLGDSNSRKASLYHLKPVDTIGGRYLLDGDALFFRLLQSSLFAACGDSAGIHLENERRVQFVAKYNRGDSIFCTDRDKDLLEASTVALYYQAHNVVYQRQTHFEELTRIESRLDFARSLTFLAAFFLFGGFAHLMVCPILRSLSGVKHNKHKDYFYRISTVRWLKQGVMLLFFAITMVVGYGTLRREQMNYNRRVYGYFESIRHQQQPESVSSINEAHASKTR